MKVVVLDKIAPEGLKMLEEAKARGITYEVKLAADGKGLKGDALKAALAEADGAVCRSGVKITAESLEGNRRLKCIARAGVGTDNIDKTAATRQGIVVMNTPTGNTLSTAEHAFALMMALSRNIAPAHQSLMEHKWERNAYMGAQLADKSLGIVGLGRIGQEFAKRAKAFQMRVFGFDPFISKERAAELGVELVETVKEMLPNIDYLTVHTPLTAETKNLISTKEIETMRKGVRLINCARGGIYDEAALVEGLKSGKVGGVALDVFEEEPCTSHALFGLPGVLCTPHLGASTEEAQTQVAIEAVQLVLNHLLTGEVRHAVNMPNIDPKTLAALRGHLDVAYRLGLLLSQWHGSGTKACRLTYRGEVAAKDTKLLSAAFCAGLLERALHEEVNVVNAETLLKERGIELVEQTRTEMGVFSSSMMAQVETATDTFTASGTLFGENMPRLIRLQDFRLETYLDGILFIFFHDDVPGIIGAVGTIFGRHNVNIAQMSVGRASPGGAAIGVLNLDTSPSQAAIDEVLAHKAINGVKVIEMPKAGEGPGWLVG